MKLQDEFDKRLSECKYAVEATRNETTTLWSECHKKVSWVRVAFGKLITVGKLNEHPVCISVSITNINGVDVLFWEATSMVVDHYQINTWFKENTEVTKINNRDAGNFHCIVQDINRKGEQLCLN